MTASRPGAHLDLATAKAYAEQTVDPAAEFSIEHHLLECAHCRQLIAAAAGQGTLAGASPERLESVWSAVEAKIDTPIPAGSQRFQMLIQRIRIFLSELHFMQSITRVRLQVAATAALVVAVVGLSAVLLRNTGPDDNVARPQSPPATSEATTAPTGSEFAVPAPAASPVQQVPITAAATGQFTPTAAPEGSFAVPALTFLPSEYIAVLWVAPGGDLGSAQEAETQIQQLVGTGITVFILRTSDLPDLPLSPSGQPPEDSLIVYAGPFGTLQDATGFCSAQPQLSQCLPLKPNPNG